MKKYKLGFIGAGNLGEALIEGLISKKTFSPKDIAVSTLSDARKVFLKRRYGVATLASNSQLVQACSVVILAVKPQTFLDLEAELKGAFRPQQLVISLAAGVTIARIQRLFWPPSSGPVRGTPRIARAMPNLPAVVGQGTSAFFMKKGGSLTQYKRDIRTLKQVLESCGWAYALEDESLMDAVTGLSGSGPAYFFYFLEALIGAGVKAGLPEKLAKDLALKTAVGSYALVLNAVQPIAELRRQVCSPKGTTIEGIKVLEEGFFVQTIERAVSAAVKRAQEISKGI